MKLFGFDFKKPSGAMLLTFELHLAFPYPIWHKEWEHSGEFVREHTVFGISWHQVHDAHGVVIEFVLGPAVVLLGLPTKIADFNEE